MKRMTLKRLYKQMPKIELTANDEDANRWINMAYEEIFRYCSLCQKKFKNHKGVILHMSKVHRHAYLYSKVMKYMPVTSPIKVGWNN